MIKEYKITYDRRSSYTNMYNGCERLVTIIDASSAKEAVEKFYKEYKNTTGKCVITYTFIDISVL